MLKRGHDVLLLQKDFDGAPPTPPSLEKEAAFKCVSIPVFADKTAGLKARYFDDIAFTKKAFRKIKGLGHFDAALVQSNNCAGFPLWMLKKMKIPAVYNEQDIFPENAIACGMLPRGLVARLATFCTKLAYHLATSVITVSEDMRRTIEKLGCPSENVHVVYNWCRGDRDYTIADENNKFLRGLEGADDCFRVVYAGNVGRMQDVGVLIEAASHLREEHIKILVVGDGAEKAPLELRSKELSLNNVQFFQGLPEADAQDVYAAADVNIITLKEGIIHTCLPSKTAACIYSRRPFIATVDPESSAAVIYRSVPYGRVVPPSDPLALANAIKACAGSFGRRYQAARHDQSEELFSWTNAFSYVGVIEKAAGSSGDSE
nr:glycosyltransferase family 4 protein [Gordonibacter massiliensis (ex Traore et al. 2017)]